MATNVSSTAAGQTAKKEVERHGLPYRRQNAITSGQWKPKVQIEETRGMTRKGNRNRIINEQKSRRKNQCALLMKPHLRRLSSAATHFLPPCKLRDMDLFSLLLTSLIPSSSLEESPSSPTSPPVPAPLVKEARGYTAIR